MSTAMRAPLPAQTRPTIEIFRLEVGGGGSLEHLAAGAAGQDICIVCARKKKIRQFLYEGFPLGWLGTVGHHGA